MFQELNYPDKAHKVLMNVDDTMAVASVRQVVGSVLGGGNLASSWGTYMIPAAIAKRPIPAGAVVTGVRITSYNVCYTKLLRAASTPADENW